MTTATIDSICSLDGERLEDRLRMIRRELLPNVQKTRELPNGVIYEFEASPEMGARLEAFVEFERTCCSSLGWSVHQDGSRLELHVDGVDARAFRSRIEHGSGPAEASPISRAAKAVGLGVGGSFLVCCVLPVGLALGMGAAVATPFMFLDDPLWIGAGSLALAIPAWLFLGRKRKATGSDAGCDC